MFNKYLKEDYQYTLTEVTFQAVERYEFSEKSRLCAVDNITTAIVGDELNVDFSRQVYFDPEAIFSIKVAFNLKIKFKTGMESGASEVNWDKEFSTKENPYMSNIITRTSNIISNLTSSFGQQPLITPPVFMA